MERHELEAVDAAFHDGSLLPEALPHEAHVYVAWKLMCEHGGAVGARRFAERIKYYIDAWDKHEKYHETVTWALLHRIAAATGEPGGSSWTSFRSQNLPLFDDAWGELLGHYSEAVLTGREAKERFVRPDLDPLPPL